MFKFIVKRFVHANNVNMLKRVGESYQKSAAKNPILVSAVQSATLMSTGDILAQLFIEKSSIKDVNLIRTGKFFCIGFFVAGPILRTWYGFLDRRVTTKIPIKRTLQKLVLDQFCFAPILLGTLVSTITFSQTFSIDRVEARLKNEYLDILRSNYFIWPWVQLVNFRFIPLNYQVLLTQSIAVVWNMYVSWKTNQDPHIHDVNYHEIMAVSSNRTPINAENRNFTID